MMSFYIMMEDRHCNLRSGRCEVHVLSQLEMARVDNDLNELLEKLDLL